MKEQKVLTLEQTIKLTELLPQKVIKPYYTLEQIMQMERILEESLHTNSHISGKELSSLLEEVTR